jgi:hypothetical protein
MAAGARSGFGTHREYSRALARRSRLAALACIVRAVALTIERACEARGERAR